jgi:Fe(II)/alpha-ketoglutarate-dependent arginine beta-hydroxylase
MISRAVLEIDEIAQINALLADLAKRHRSVEDEQFMRHAAVYAHELPRRIRQHLHEFKLREPIEAMCVISNYPIDEQKIGATPAHWKERNGTSPALEEEMLLVLFGSLLGEPIAWATQQDGHLVHDIAPIKGHENEQLGSGSEQLLWWHTEDAFHPQRGDYIGLLCLRNLDRVPTTFASLQGVELTERQRQLLFEPHYTIRPDESHLLKNKSENRTVEGELGESYRLIERMNTNPDKIAIFSGDPASPYIRLDPYFMDPVEEPEARAALEALVKAIDGSLVEVPLETGEFCFIDNFKGVHGRKPFRARYDGKDRWLKRINVVRDLRRSRAFRAGAENRVIG